MNRRILSGLLALSLIFAACGADDDAGIGPIDELDLEGVEIQLMGWSSSPAEDAALGGLIDKFNEETGARAFFNAVPEYDAILGAALAGGEPPDVFYVDSFRMPDFLAQGVLDVGEGKISDPNDIYDSLRNAFSADGTLYCPPKDFSTLALIYDVDAFAEAGLEPPTTWDELAAAAETLTTGDQAGLTIGVEYPRWGAFLAQAGAWLTNDDFTEMTIDTPEAREALEFVAGLYDRGHAVSPADVDAGWAGEAFGQGKAAMTIEGNWIVGYLRESFPDKNWAAAELPQGPGGQGTMAFTVCYGVAANAANLEAAWALADWLTRPEQAIEWTQAFPVMPARASVRDQWVEANPDLEAFVRGADYARAWQFTHGFPDVLGVFNDNAQAIVAGTGSVDRLIQETDEAGLQVLGQ